MNPNKSNNVANRKLKSCRHFFDLLSFGLSLIQEKKMYIYVTKVVVFPPN